MDTKSKNINPLKQRQRIIILRAFYLFTAWLGVALLLAVQLYSGQLSEFDESKEYDTLMDAFYQQVYSTYFSTTKEAHFAHPTYLKLSALNKIPHLQYCIISTSGAPISNINAGQIKSPQDFYMFNAKIKSYNDMDANSTSKSGIAIQKPPYPYEVLIGLSEMSYNQFNAEFKMKSEPYALFGAVAGAIASFTLSFISSGWCIVTRRREYLTQGTTKDRPLIPLDVAVCAIIALSLFAWSQFHSHSFSMLLSSDYLLGIHQTVWMFIFPSLFALLAVPIMLYVESFCLFALLGKLPQTFFVVQLFSTIKRRCKALWQSIGLGPSLYYAIALLAAYSVSTLFIIWVTDYYYLPWPFTSLSGMTAILTLLRFSGLFFINILALIILLNKFRAVEALTQAADQIISGDPQIKLRPMGGPKLEKLAHQLTHISEGLSKAIEQEIKAERLKTKLITNVSHDLKTPITAISSYVDLLNQEGVASPNAPEYLQVITTRVEKLKILTQDLFDAAKANSGSLPIELTRIDLNAMVLQALGELSDALQASTLDVHSELPERSVWIEADGKYLWRVLENLLSNCIRHSQPQTRVYIALTQSDSEARLTFKNVSHFPLNIPPEQLMERFVRGDDSRHSDGSGLGLAIAKDLTELQKGTLTLAIDGDLFKTTLSFKLSTPQS